LHLFRPSVYPKQGFPDGHELYKSLLMSVIIPDGFSKEQAINYAIKEFENKMKINNWQVLAEFYEVS